VIKILVENRLLTPELVLAGGWVGGWMDGWIDGLGVTAVLRDCLEQSKNLI
jgi:hypothetical protein